MISQKLMLLVFNILQGCVSKVWRIPLPPSHFANLALSEFCFTLCLSGSFPVWHICLAVPMMPLTVYPGYLCTCSCLIQCCFTDIPLFKVQICLYAFSFSLLPYLPPKEKVSTVPQKLHSAKKLIRPAAFALSEDAKQFKEVELVLFAPI